MKILVSHVVEIDQREIDRIFHDKLDKLTGGQWVDGNKLMEEHCTSHRYDAKVGDQTHPRFELVKTICHLKKLLKDAK